MKPITLFVINTAICVGMVDYGYDLRLTGNGYVITFSNHLDAHRFTIGLTHILGGADEALEAYKNIGIHTFPNDTGVEMTLFGSIVGC